MPASSPAAAAPPLVVIAGPTAGGKSAFALALADVMPATIVNADSAQCYRDLRIVTARPDAADEARAPHRLYGTRDGAEPASAADWAGEAEAEIAAAHAGGRLPILVGGTGLYLRTLLDGIAPVPAIRPEVRAAVRGRDAAANRDALRRADPAAAARLHPGDTQRIARALEVALSTGRTLAEWQAERTGGIGGSVRLFAHLLLPPRALLHDRCDRRFERMVDDGRPEVEALLARGLDPALPVMNAIGLREIGALVRGELTRAEAVAAGQAATRRYVKRQATWFRNQSPPDWTRIEEPMEPPAATERVRAFAATFAGA